MTGGAAKATVGLRGGAGAAPKGPPVSQESLPTVGIDLPAAALPHHCVVSEFHYQLSVSHTVSVYLHVYGIKEYIHSK